MTCSRRRCAAARQSWNDAWSNAWSNPMSDGTSHEKEARHGGLTLDAAKRERADALAARLEKYRASYYAGTPEISDAAYDALEDELRDMDPTHPVLARVGSGAL